MTTGVLTREAALAAIDRSLCERSFADFLTYCQIRSDDPLAPGIQQLSPWPYQVARAESWQAGTSEVILKERQLGFSAVLVAPYMLWRAMYHGWACGYLSVGQAEAREEIQRIKALYASLPSHLKVAGTIRADDAEFRGGGRIIAFPSTEHAGISYTLQLVVMDEAAFHPYGGANYAAIQPAAALGQFIILSTADPSLGPSGFFYDMYWASKREETPYLAVFEARHRPDRDEQWYRVARSAFPGREEEFDAYYPETDSAAFVGRSGLVYPMWGPQYVTGYDPFTWQAAKYRVGGVDFGGGDPTAVLALGVSGTRKVHQFDEMYSREPVGVEEIGTWLMERHKLAPFFLIACDPSQGIAIQSLKAAGLPAIAADNAREGISALASMLGQSRFTVHERNRGSIAEFPGYRWASRTDPNDRSRYATSTPVDHHADAMDARRYALRVVEGVERTSAPYSQPLVVDGQKLTGDEGKPEFIRELRARMRAQEKPVTSTRIR